MHQKNHIILGPIDTWRLQLENSTRPLKEKEKRAFKTSLYQATQIHILNKRNDYYYYYSQAQLIIQSLYNSIALGIKGESIQANFTMT